MKQHQSTLGKSDEWITPPYIIKSLGDFDLDPCNCINPPFKTAKNSYTILDDGLNRDWYGRVWLNPPFNRKIRPLWMEKMSIHNNGIMLIPAACETKPFKEFVFSNCSGILMLDHRPHFLYSNGMKAKANSGCTICLVAYGENNLESLIKSGLGQVLTRVNY